MDDRRLGREGPAVSPIGFGAFKIGRNEKTKYAEHYELPDECEVAALLNGLLDAGINYIDTAPAYGVSEERIGRAIAHRRDEFTLSTKVGEQFAGGVSTYDFSRTAIERSIHGSLQRLQTDVLDLVFLHSPGDDLAILRQSDAVETLDDMRTIGVVRAIGLSAKTAGGIEAALPWADAVMVEYHAEDATNQAAIAAAHAAGVGVVVKKGLAAGSLAAHDAIRFVLANPHVTTLVIGSLSLAHMRENLSIARGM